MSRGKTRCVWHPLCFWVSSNFNLWRRRLTMRKPLMTVSVIALACSLSQLAKAQLLHQGGAAGAGALNQAKAGSLESSSNAASTAHLDGTMHSTRISAGSAESGSTSSQLKSSSAASGAHL